MWRESLREVLDAARESLIKAGEAVHRKVEVVEKDLCAEKKWTRRDELRQVLEDKRMESCLPVLDRAKEDQSKSQQIWVPIIWLKTSLRVCGRPPER